jgi:hypothetical protein
MPLNFVSAHNYLINLHNFVLKGILINLHILIPMLLKLLEVEINKMENESNIECNDNRYYFKL